MLSSSISLPDPSPFCGIRAKWAGHCGWRLCTSCSELSGLPGQPQTRLYGSKTSALIYQEVGLSMVAIGSVGHEIPRVRIWPPRQSHSLSRLGQPPVHIHSLLSGHTEEGSLSFLNIALVT